MDTITTTTTTNQSKLFSTSLPLWPASFQLLEQIAHYRTLDQSVVEARLVSAEQRWTEGEKKQSATHHCATDFYFHYFEFFSITSRFLPRVMYNQRPAVLYFPSRNRDVCCSSSCVCTIQLLIFYYLHAKLIGNRRTPKTFCGSWRLYIYSQRCWYLVIKRRESIPKRRYPDHERMVCKTCFLICNKLVICGGKLYRALTGWVGLGL